MMYGLIPCIQVRHVGSQQKRITLQQVRNVDEDVLRPEYLPLQPLADPRGTKPDGGGLIQRQQSDGVTNVRGRRNERAERHLPESVEVPRFRCKEAERSIGQTHGVDRTQTHCVDDRLARVTPEQRLASALAYNGS